MTAPDVLTMKERAITTDRYRDEVLNAATLVQMADGDFDINRVRPLLPEWCAGNALSAAMSGLVNSGAAVHTGRFARNGDRKSRNGNKPVHIYRLTVAR